MLVGGSVSVVAVVGVGGGCNFRLVQKSKTEKKKEAASDK